MGITLKETGVDLLGDKLYIEDRGHRIEKIVWRPRIGISVGTERAGGAMPTGHVCVSGRYRADRDRRAI